MELGVPDLCTSFNVQVLLGKQVKPTVDCILAIKDVFDRRVEGEERRVAAVPAVTAEEMAFAAEAETEMEEVTDTVDETAEETTTTTTTTTTAMSINGSGASKRRCCRHTSAPPALKTRGRVCSAAPTGDDDEDQN